MKVFKFYADWCQPCKVLSKTLETMDHPLLSFIEERNVDLAENKELLMKYQLRSIPALVVVSDADEKLAVYRGVGTQEQIQDFLDRNWTWGA
jgi:thioredoxin 1